MHHLETVFEQVLATLGMHLPILLVLAAGLLMILFNVPSGKPRGMVALALTMLLGIHLLQVIMMIVPPTLLMQPDVDSLRVIRIVRSIRIIFSLIEATGYGLLLVALVRLLRQVHAMRPSTR